ncbi:hypothetical protein [Marinibactrum halimedae]|uniref:SPOR domain-containing protein n=1 Tax=Marinibactrum halimedae TaxID=1444977 RepID=A0AA37T972_9GAMM|nr:hypothetical protein [Marinibactrum halimedae]MCD9461290.1 hypothetical protein [Marinibactrum halimedae]GLS27227.1 hypothetical protein GCM10007877_29460 [Marinibactrum halimedae]
MRFVLYFLLVVNVLVFLVGWVSNSAPASESLDSIVDFASGSPLKLIEEVDRNLLREKSEATALAQAKGLCAMAGPFKLLTKADVLVERLLALDVKSDIREVDVPVDHAYWVYLEPEVSRVNALKKLKELQEQNIDSYVIPKNELENGISLGMFNNQDLALARKKEIMKLGYQPKIKNVPRSTTQNWVVVEPEEAQKLGVESWQRMLDGMKGVSYKQNYCPDVASLQ